MQRHHALVLTFVAGLLAGCTVPDNKAHRVLEGAGYTGIQLGGHAWGFVCAGSEQLSATKFSAVGPNGQHVDGAVCCGAVAKACTIRLD